MKLFQRTLLSFVGVIALQAGLTGSALSSIFGSMQSEDVDREISAEAANAYDAFNAWKLAFWKEINELAEDEGLARAVGASRLSPARDEGVARALSLRLSSSAIEATALLDESTPFARYVESGRGESGLPELGSFAIKKEHPYVEIVSVRGGLCFVGAVRVKSLGVFIVKRIDAELLSHLSYDPMVAVGVSAPGAAPGVAGSYSGAARSGAAERQALDYALELVGSAKAASAGGAYTAYPREDWMGGSYSAVVQRTGTVASPEGERPVLLAAVLSLASYGSRVARLQSSVVAISLIAVAITIIVALLLSRSIVSPIRNLSKATRRIAEGDYRAAARSQGSGEIGELLASFNGMAEKLAADKLERELYVSEIVGLKKRADGIIESIREGLAVVDAEGRVESANASFRALFGEGAGAEGSLIVDIRPGPFDGALVDAAREALRDRESRAGITRRSADGRSFEIKLYPLVAATRPEDARCVIIVEDVSDRLAYEARVIQADKLASIGMLSAGVAHEINNPLSSILANLGNAISEAGAPEAVASLKVVERETHRIARIVRQLLDFSAPGRPGEASGDGPPRCDANAVAAELLLLVSYPFKGESRVEFLESLDPACPEVAIAEDELKQVLLNLLKNALHAVGGEGTIRVGTRALAGSVELSVADDGPGIQDDILGRIFDPFFTTKPREGPAGLGRGLGLGLSVVYGIVTKRGGSIRASNEAGGGALFVATLPSACGG